MRKLLMIICTAISCVTFAQGIITSSASSEVYNGVLSKSISYGSNNSTTVEGLITVTARWKTEKIAASVVIDGKKYAFSKPEKLSDYSYKFIYKIKKSTESLILTLNFSGNDISGSLQGPITGGADFEVRGSRNRFKDKKSLEYSLATSLQGQYNATVVGKSDIVISDPSIALSPYGSYFTVKVSKNGSAKVSVSLSDGTKASASSQLTLFKHPTDPDSADFIGVPFDIPLYSKKGSISGIFFIDSEDKTISSSKFLRDFSDDIKDYYSDIKWHRESTTGSASLIFDVEGRVWNIKDVADAHIFNLDVDSFPPYFNKGIEYSVKDELLPTGITASYNGKTMVVEKTASKFRLSVAKATGIISGSFTVFYPSGDPKRPKPRSVTAKIYGVMINDSYSGISAEGFVSIAETNPTLRKINKVVTIPFTISEPHYIVVDLSAGSSAKTYPVSYLADEPATGWTDEYKTDKIVFRKIPAGTFMMGSPTSETDRYDNETQHEVTLTKPFYMGIFEVTQKQYELVTGDKPSRFTGDTLPVERVSWDMIKDGNIGFMNVLSKKVAGLSFDLPTEAQWEYACRAGTTGAYNVVGKELSDLGWFSDNSERKTHTVGGKLPNAWGLYDMYGNVAEWCRDWSEAYPTGAVTDPTGPGAGDKCIIRGGGWNADTRLCRSACRSRGVSSYALGNVGFRPVAFSGF